MDEQFDNKLSNHIREVFDNYQHPGAGHGWAQLKKQLPAEEKGSKIAWLWWSSAAAVILVCLGIGLWYNNQSTVVNNIVVKPVAKKQQPAVIKDTAVINSAAPLSNNPPVIAKNNAGTILSPGIAAPAHTAPIGNKLPAGNTANAQIAQATSGITGQPQPIFNTIQPTTTANVTPAAKNNQVPLIDSQKVLNNITGKQQLANTQLAAANTTIQPAAGNTDNNNAAQSLKRSMADMFNDDKQQQTAKQNNADNQDTKKVNFSIYAATYFNYAEGSANQINAGAGVTSDFRLSKKLKLSTGIALAQNSLSYNTAAPQAANTMFAAAAPLKQASLFGTAALVPVFKNYNASLVGLDIPINLKYEFNPQKSDAYISAGLSSGTFIDESYTYRYTYSNGTSSPSDRQTEQTAHNSFNSFYFGKTLNLSFGLGYPIGNNRLIVEPFVKYPLGGLGAQDIRFGAGGVNLKFSFKTRKK